MKTSDSEIPTEVLIYSGSPQPKGELQSNLEKNDAEKIFKIQHEPLKAILKGRLEQIRAENKESLNPKHSKNKDNSDSMQSKQSKKGGKRDHLSCKQSKTEDERYDLDLNQINKVDYKRTKEKKANGDHTDSKTPLMNTEDMKIEDEDNTDYKTPLMKTEYMKMEDEDNTDSKTTLMKTEDRKIDR